MNRVRRGIESCEGIYPAIVVVKVVTRTAEPPGVCSPGLPDKTIYDYDKTMKRAMVSELKMHLSSYLAHVRRGQSVVVCDRATPIARLIPYEPDEEEGFEVLPATLPVRDLRKVRGVRTKRPIDVVRLLRQDRDAR